MTYCHNSYLNYDYYNQLKFKAPQAQLTSFMHIIIPDISSNLIIVIYLEKYINLLDFIRENCGQK